MQGKVADVVMAVRNGEQIVRKYQPIVSNPSTPAQVEARAKLKLMSQLSAVMAPVIAIPKQGSVSSRNMFVKKNYGFTTYAQDKADVSLTSIQLTSSVVSMNTLSASREGSVLTVELSGIVSPDIDRVVYALFRFGFDNTLRYGGSNVVEKGTGNPNFSSDFTLDFGGEEVVIYAYGMRDNTEAARATFGNMSVVSAETVARVIVSRTLLESDVTLTETAAIRSTKA